MHLAKIPMTNDRSKCGISVGKLNLDKIKDKDGIDHVLKEEIIDYDDDGNIRGVLRIWQ